MKYLMLAAGALTISACGYLPGGGTAMTSSVSPERVRLFVATVEAAGCTIPQADNDHLLDPAGFSDAEASAISQRLLAEGRAEITPAGDLALLTPELRLMLRRLHHEQPDSFAFTPGNLDWARRQVAKYPEGRQASAVIPLLWRAQEQEGWTTRPAIEAVARMLGMAYVRVLEVATFYFMFQLAPVGRVAHVQVCGTTSCMICGAEDLIAVCRERIAPNPFELSSDGNFSWEEVECLGACANAPMAQIGKDYYEDLDPERFLGLLDVFAGGAVPVPGPQDGRFASEPKGGTTALRTDGDTLAANASVTLALELGDTVRRITGETPLPMPANDAAQERRVGSRVSDAAPEVEPMRPAGLPAPLENGPDDLKRIKGIGPKLETLLFQLGYFHYDQLASWSPAEIAWVDDNLEDFRGRIVLEGWVEQARVLAQEGDTQYSNRRDRGSTEGESEG